jgi:hypothetical protein
MAILILKTPLQRHRTERYLNAQKVENAFKYPFDIMKHRFVDITKIAFQDVHKAVYEFLGPFAYLKLNKSDFIQVALFDTQGAENEYVWPLDILKTLIHRLHQSRFLGRSDDEILWASFS